jgi:formate dehydrogenase iron-sulfur subunit
MEEINMNRYKANKAGLSRRDFIGALGIGLGSACVLGSMDTIEVLANSDNRQRAILYDSTKCIGCHTCEKACKTANNLPGSVPPVTEDTTTGTTTETTTTISETTTAMTTVTTSTIPALTVGGGLNADTWLKVTVEQNASTDDSEDYICTRHACMHCGSCAKVCPAKALVQREDGIVTMNPDRCIGCHYCHAACPFEIPQYGKDGAMQKCTMCYQRVDEGKEPACVEACPTHALSFGFRDELLPKGQEIVITLKQEGFSDAYLYGEDELGGIPLMYALPDSFRLYGLPKLPLEEQTPLTWKDFTVPVGIIAGMAALAVGGITYIKNRGNKTVVEESAKDK